MPFTMKQKWYFLQFRYQLSTPTNWISFAYFVIRATLCWSLIVPIHVELRQNMKCIYICMRNASGLPPNLEIHESIKCNHLLVVHEYCSLAPVLVDMRWDHFRLKRPNLQRFENSQVWLKKIVRNNLSTGNANFWDDNCSISHAFHIHVYLVYWLRQGLADFGLNYILTVQNH